MRDEEKRQLLIKEINESVEWIIETEDMSEDEKLSLLKRALRTIENKEVNEVLHGSY